MINFFIFSQFDVKASRRRLLFLELFCVNINHHKELNLLIVN